jgi:hypothetical protein
LQQGDNGILVVSRGQHQHGGVLSGLPDSSQQFHSIQFGQHEVEQHHVVGIRFCQEQSLLTVGGNIHRVAGAFAQTAGDVFGEPGLIFDYQHAHNVPLQAILSGPAPVVGRGVPDQA